MSNEILVVRGTESQLTAFQGELQDFLAKQHIPRGRLAPSSPAPVKRRLTDAAPLGHEPWVELMLRIGEAVASGVISTVLKDVIVTWIKDRARRRGLLVESKDDPTG